ncbi:MAG: DNA polymerase III subunit beta [Alphaproteobacteria bacterium]|nr:DNA polymerase III subunit beta [Alphaproteobacteria bacterium]
MHAVLENKHEALARLCREYDVARLELFGSAARSDDFDPQTSDFDFLVEFKPGSSLSPIQQFFGLAQDLESLLGHHVDLVEASSIQNPFLLDSINQSRKIVYGA